jgi:polysaccharide pyruvyl transferase WcaK-like protein
MTAGGVRVGLFGLLGSGNIGNDASMESVLHYLRTERPDTYVDAMCPGPAQLASAYGIEATPLWSYQQWKWQGSGISAVALKVIGKAIDTFRIASWVRRHDVVIVPGMGVLEATLPLRALGEPYAMFLLSAFGRTFGTKVAFVSIGASVIKQRLTRWFFNSAAGLAFYCSYRDERSREVMRLRNGGALKGRVYPDLAFSNPIPVGSPGDPGVVAVGVMDFHGSNDERRRASEIYESYFQNMKSFILWLLDSGRRVLLFVGDTTGYDDGVVDRMVAELHLDRPTMTTAQVRAVRASSFADVARAMAPASAVIATRFHNVICALMLSKPTIAIGYAPKHDALMADMGLPDLCEPARALDVDRLIEQFTKLQDRAPEVRQHLELRNAELRRQLATQFEELSMLLLPASAQPAPGEQRQAGASSASSGPTRGTPAKRA